MSENPIDILREFFGVDEEDAEAILMLTHWVEQQLATEEYGYPKDNLIPPPLVERLAEDRYLDKLLEAAKDQEPSLVDVVAQKR